jgi:hypothetical protein
MGTLQPTSKILKNMPPPDPNGKDPALTPEQMLQQRKYRIEARLVDLGIKDYQISYLPYLEDKDIIFQTPYDAGCRLLILYAVSYATHNLDHRPDVVEWLKAENLWSRVSPVEEQFFGDPEPEETTLQDLSWRIESVLTLGWVLNLVPVIHDIDKPETDDEMELLLSAIPPIGAETGEFLTQLIAYRDRGEIYEENLLNEMATGYFRDLLFNGHADETSINRMVSFERHFTLNWLRKFSDIENWDDTDTST